MGDTDRRYRKKYHIIQSSAVKELVHGSVVSNLAYQIGRQMGLSDEECNDLAVAGLLHDIGKLELAKYVREKKDGTLVIEEIRYIRVHSNLSALLLMEKGYSQNIVNMVKFHHENCDGSGYPLGLSREEIPLGARILRVCDVFAALTAERTYRKAFDVNTAMKIMIEESRYYDVEVFLAFMNVVHSDRLAEILDTKAFEERLTINASKEGRTTILSE